MDLFVIVSDTINNTSELKIMTKDSRKDKNNVYKYEPIASCATLEEAESLKKHIESIGIQSFFKEIVESVKKI
ncbi:hypothetical protein [uncultured Granulicatella sp.]|uniref:hypothetical protein n=1 Tax=uncultured Granulicatella sp. TaxID=316089 RepID=UPI0028D6F70C|nr:hypothetical protein [uncultured Granulicatella sp.]